MSRDLPPGWPVFGEDEIEAAAGVLRSGRVNYWTGEEARAFEREFAAFLGAQHAVALTNGTAALEAALHALDIGAGDEVIVPSRSFVATASTVAMRGAVPVFIDVDRDSQNIDPAAITAAVGDRTRAVIAVHLAGWPCDMDAILAIARQRRLKVIEDCAQAHGASWRGRMVGAFGDVGAFSFCQDKIMTTAGEGGMVVTRDPGLWRRVWEYKDHGKNWDKMQDDGDGAAFRWVHDSLGTNLRMTEVQAAVGRMQLCKLPGWLERRRANAEIMVRRLSVLPALRVPVPPAHCRHAWYRFYCFVRPERLKPGWSRDRIVTAVRERGFHCQAGSCSEIYLEKPFQDRGLVPARRLPVARELGETSLMFQVHPVLGAADMEQLADTVAAVIGEAAA
jgi:dTDP-4-amino-4,6-dideoxygalactose transaminase